MGFSRRFYQVRTSTQLVNSTGAKEGQIHQNSEAQFGRCPSSFSCSTQNGLRGAERYFCSQPGNSQSTVRYSFSKNRGRL